MLDPADEPTGDVPDDDTDPASDDLDALLDDEGNPK